MARVTFFGARVEYDGAELGYYSRQEDGGDKAVYKRLNPHDFAELAKKYSREGFVRYLRELNGTIAVQLSTETLEGFEMVLTESTAVPIGPGIPLPHWSTKKEAILQDTSSFLELILEGMGEPVVEHREPAGYDLQGLD